MHRQFIHAQERRDRFFQLLAMTSFWELCLWGESNLSANGRSVFTSSIIVSKLLTLQSSLLCFGMRIIGQERWLIGKEFAMNTRRPEFNFNAHKKITVYGMHL